eukprot:TRINITY_DN22081_c0_g1_i1.p1 TRINITY_DN22081_c0_g1~~TRINITY_DN22081_c0_g1_i1.p1  ORF type:complete len:677 (+),score=90.46 TRINITY_DN22081_c0_g1_i1:41-2032(+)
MVDLWDVPPQPPPVPLTIEWLVAYGRFQGPRLVAVQEEELDTSSGAAALLPGCAPCGQARLLRAQCEDGSEASYVLRRASGFASGAFGLELEVLEHEFRFYTEIAAASVSSAWALPSLKRGVVEAAATVGAQGADGELAGDYEVIYPRVILRSKPAANGLSVGVLRSGDRVRAFASCVDGEPWLRLSEETVERLGIGCSPVFAPLNGRRFGHGDRLYLHRLVGTPGPDPEDWRNIDVIDWVSKGCGAISSDAGCAPLLAEGSSAADRLSGEERWIALAGRLRKRSLRVPQLYSSCWNNSHEGYLLALECLPSESWVHANPLNGFTLEQAGAAVEALANMHEAFSAPGKLAAYSWIRPLPRERSMAALAEQYQACFERLHHSVLKYVVPPGALAVCVKLQTQLDMVLEMLTTPPLTLLYGNVQLDSFWFSTATPHKPSVAAADWRFLCCGRGAFELAAILGLCLDTALRRESERDLMELYMGKAKTFGESAGGLLSLFAGGTFVTVDQRAQFDDELRAGLLLVFALFLVRSAGALESTCAAPGSGYAGTAGVTSAEKGCGNARLTLARLASAIEDWDCGHIVGLEPEPTQTRGRKAKAKSKAKAKRRTPSAKKSSGGSGASTAKAKARSRSATSGKSSEGGGRSGSPSPRRKAERKSTGGKTKT